MQKLTRIERRKRNRQIKFKLFLLMTIISLIMVFVIKSDLFKIDKIIVTGNTILDTNKIIESSRISKGENIFKTDTNKIRQNVEELSYVKEGKVRIKLPDTITIDLIERKEAFFIKNISAYIIVDDEGYILQQVDEKHKALPVVLGLKIRQIKSGNNIFTEPKASLLEEFIVEANRLNILKLVEQIDIEIPEQAKIQLNNGIDIAFGGLDNVKYKLGMLEEILKDLEKKEIKCNKILMNRGSHPIIITED